MNTMIHTMLQTQASDVHFHVIEGVLTTYLRANGEMIKSNNPGFHLKFYVYLKYLSGFDLSNLQDPQSASFQYTFEGNTYDFRFSIIHSLSKETAVLRMLYQAKHIPLRAITSNEITIQQMKTWMQKRSGLLVLSGPTGSGKTTTLHALLQYAYEMKASKVMTMEDPIEIHNDNFIQLQMQDANDFTMEKVLQHILRHDPDIIMVGEIRSSEEANMLLQSALTGHLVLTTLHASNAMEVILRLEQLGLHKSSLKQVLLGVCNQRLYHKTKKKRKETVIEILSGSNLNEYLQTGFCSKHKSLHDEVKLAIQEGRIQHEEAKQDLFNE